MAAQVRLEVPKSTVLARPLIRLLEARYPDQLRATRETTTTTVAHLWFPDRGDQEVVTPEQACARVRAALGARGIRDGVQVTPYDPDRKRRRRRHPATAT